jgi:IS5 family transposase
VRSRVEHLFGFNQNSMGGKLIHTIGMVRTKIKVGLMILTYDLMRYLPLIKRRKLGPCSEKYSRNLHGVPGPARVLTS